MAFVPVTTISLTTTASKSWVDWDLSAYIPSGATGACILMRNSDGSAARDVGVRKNGATDTLINNIVAGRVAGFLSIGVDANRVVEIYASDANCTFILYGYYDSNAVFFTNVVDKTPGSSGAWTDIDITANLVGGDTCTGAICYLYASNGSYALNVRVNGSTDDRVGAPSAGNISGAIVGTDANDVFEGYSGLVGSNKVYLIGYVKTNATYNTNATDISLGVVSAYTTINTTTGASGAFMNATGTRNLYQAYRQNGTADDYYYVNESNNTHALCGTDTSGQFQIKINNTGTDHFLMGYFMIDPPGATAAATNTTGTTITVSFDKAMSDPTGMHGDFSLIEGTATRTFNTASLNTDTTKIDLIISGAAIAYGKALTLSYTAGTLTSSDGGVLATFTGLSITNNVPAPSTTTATTVYLEKALYRYLVAQSTITDLVSTKIYPVKAPQTIKEPFVVFDRVSSDRLHAMYQDTTYCTTNIQFNIYADSRKSAKLICAALKTLLKDYTGALGDSSYTCSVSAVNVLNEIDDYFKETHLYITILELEFNHFE